MDTVCDIIRNATLHSTVHHSGLGSKQKQNKHNIYILDGLTFTNKKKKICIQLYRLKRGPVFQMLVLPTHPLGGSVMFSFSKSSWMD